MTDTTHDRRYEDRLRATDDTSGLSVDQVQTGLLAACTKIAAHWAEMIPAEAKGRPHSHVTSTGGNRPAVITDLALDARARTSAQLASWVLLVAEERGLWPGLSATDGPALAEWLGRHHDWLARHEAGRDALGELAPKARLVAWIANPERKDEEFFVGPCPGCEARLHAPVDAVSIHCEWCEEAHHRTEVRRLAVEAARTKYMPAEEIAEASFALVGKAITTTMIRGWVAADRRGADAGQCRPIASGRGRGGVMTYNIGDVWDRYDAEQDALRHRRRAAGVLRLARAISA